MAIYLVTSNKNKLREFEEILGFKLKHIDLDLDEIQAVDGEEVIEHKARQAFQKISAKGGSASRSGSALGSEARARREDPSLLDSARSDPLSAMSSRPNSESAEGSGSRTTGSRTTGGKKPVIVEDTGLYFEAWNGLPGALAKLFDQTIGYRNLPKLLKKNRKAKAKTVIGYFDGKNYKNFIGEIDGTISRLPRGKNNFGWDIIFIPKGEKRTFAQMTAEEKNKISMRKIALEKLKKFLIGYEPRK